LKGGTLAGFTTREGLPSNKIYFITGDASGALWMSGPAGIVSASRREMENLAREGSGRLAVRLYSTAEGLSTNQMMGGVQSAGAVALDGDLWFPSAKGAVRINPLVPDRAGVSPPLIEQTLADDRPVAVSEGISLPPGQGKLEIHYTAIRLSSPERLRFRYWMQGFDPEWTDAGQRRVAYYTNLPPGDYKFHVVAYEMNAPRSAAERVLGVSWAPHFYQTNWFLGLCLVVLAAVAWVAYRVHVHNLRRRFEAVLEERSRLAREMHDTLIQGCVGVSALLEAASQAQTISPEISNQLVERARTEVRAAVDEARIAVWNLRHDKPQNGLVATISQLVHRIGSETGVPVRFETSGVPLSLGDEGERSFVMLVREALTNAVRHAAPKNVSVRLRFDRRSLHAEIEDDGSGFDPSAEPEADDYHYGLIGMHERVAGLGGELSLSSSPGKGTQVRLIVPGRKT